MIFAEQQWKLRQDNVARTYGNVSNALAIHPQRARPKEVLLVVPTEFFLLAENLFTEEQRLDMRHGPALHFYLDQVDKGGWVFGVELGHDAGPARGHVDLWGYTTSTLPPWVELAIPSRT
jgi:hypothetical protein